MASLVDLVIPPELDKAVTLVVDTSSSEGEEGEEEQLEVVVKKSDVEVESSSVQISKLEEVKKYNIEFTPPSPDEYTVAITHAGKDVLDSPLKLNLSCPDAKQVLLTQPPTGKIRAGQSITILFDTYSGGRGELTGICHGESAGDIPVVVTRQGLTTVHQVTFLPTQEDEYSLAVSYAGKQVKGSPYKIDLIPVNPDKVQCSKPVIPENLEGPIEMDVCTEGAGTSHLKAKCEGEDCGQVKVDVKKLSKNDYHLKFEPPKKDKFTLAVLYGGKHIKDSPFIIDISSKIENVKLGELHVPECVGTEEDVWVELDCSEAGKEEVKAECKGQNEERPVPVSIEEYEPCKHRISFSPKIPDIYNLTIFFGDSVLPGGIFNINLLPKSDSKLVKHLGTFIPDDRKDPVVLKFDASKAGEGEMRARANGVLQAGPVVTEVVLVDEETKEYQVSFLPDGADTYNVDVYWSNETIPGSPIYVKIVYPSEVLVTDPVGPQLLHPIKVDVDTQYAGPGVLSVSCSGKNSGEIDVEIIQSETDNTKYEVSFRPIEPDFYSLRIFFNDIEVKYSPKEVDLEPQPVDEAVDAVIITQEEFEVGSPVDQEEETVDPEPTRMDLTVGQPLTLTVDSLEGDSRVAAAASGEKVGEVPVSITSNETEGSFNVVFDPIQPDVYTVEVKLSDEHVPGSPFIINYMDKPKPEVIPAPPTSSPPTPSPPTPSPPTPSPPTPSPPTPSPPIPTDPSPIPTSPIPADPIPTHPITRPYLIQYVPKDGVYEIQAHAIHDDSCTREVLKIRSRKNGKALLVFNAKQTGLHYIHIKQGEAEIKGSPFKLDIVPSDPSACRIVGIPEKIYVGEKSVIKIDSSKAGTGDMHVIATVPVGGKETRFSHSERSAGKFDINFTPTVPGNHSLTIKWTEVAIPGSPIFINAVNLTEDVKQARDAASRVRVDDERNVFKLKLEHSDGAIFFVHTEKAGQGELTVKAKGPGNAKISVIKRKGAIYKCRAQPDVSGKYDLDILWNNIRIPGHPYQLDFTASKTYIISDLDLESERFEIGQAYQYSVDCSQQKGKLEIIAIPSDCVSEASVTPREGCEGVYTVRIEPQKVGNHELALKFAGKDLLRSPYHVQFESVTTPEQDAENQEDNKLLRLSGIDFPICLEDPPPEASSGPLVPAKKPETTTVTASGPGLDGGVIGQEGNFTVVTGGAGDGKLEIGIHGARGTFKTHLRRHPDHDRTVLARYDPTHIGKYTIDILWANERIEGSPFEVDIKSQETE